MANRGGPEAHRRGGGGCSYCGQSWRASAGVMRWCWCLSAIETESKFLSCSKFQQCQFLLKEMAESAEERATCLTPYPSFALRLENSIIQDNESKLEMLAENFYFCKFLFIFFNSNFKIILVSAVPLLYQFWHESWGCGSKSCAFWHLSVCFGHKLHFLSFSPEIRCQFQQ